MRVINIYRNRENMCDFFIINFRKPVVDES